MQQLNFNVKTQMVALSGSCFWFWDSFYSFLESCGVKRPHYLRYGKEGKKYFVMRNILEDLEREQDAETIQKLISTFYRMKTVVDKDQLDEKKGKQLLEEFRQLVGDDPIEKEIEKRDQQRRREENRNAVAEKAKFESDLDKLWQRFCALTTDTLITPQNKGYALEKLVFDLLILNEFECSPSFRADTGEQIDGQFKHDGFPYLIECKWTSKPVEQNDISEFNDKITGKLQSTRGFYISAAGCDERAVKKFSGDNPRIILTNGEDLTHILQGRLLLLDAIRAKIDAAVKHGNIDLRLRSLF
ncbi:MAG: restriction endonuclease [Candidatus Peribacter sp.]|nr:restriction endonuclease [Candidatus Peribacter sp.]